MKEEKLASILGGMVNKISLTGVSVREIRPMTKQEMLREGWTGLEAATVIVFENGVHIFASRDPEGNGPGCLFGYDTHENRAFQLP